MPTEVFEDSQEIEIGLLEAELPSSASDSFYPYPRLKPLGRYEARAFRTVLLENDTLRLTVLPDLGGRLISVFDKRTNTEILPSSGRLTVADGGPRGVSLPWGIAPAALPQLPLPAKIRTRFMPAVEIDNDPDRAEDDDYIDRKYHEVQDSIQRGMDALARKRALPLFG